MTKYTYTMVHHLLAETLEEYNDVYYKIFKIFYPVPYMSVFCTGD